jgi:hypothetical protein
MKYMMLAYTNAARWAAQEFSSEEIQAACEFYENLTKELIETGEFVTTEGLADPTHTKTIRKVDGVPVATDGPFAESKEVLVSYAILDCDSYDRAVEIATRVVDAVGDPVEIRPIMDGAGLEM